MNFNSVIWAYWVQALIVSILALVQMFRIPSWYFSWIVSEENATYLKVANNIPGAFIKVFYLLIFVFNYSLAFFLSAIMLLVMLNIANTSPMPSVITEPKSFFVFVTVYIIHYMIAFIRKLTTERGANKDFEFYNS